MSGLWMGGGMVLRGERRHDSEWKRERGRGVEYIWSW